MVSRTAQPLPSSAGVAAARSVSAVNVPSSRHTDDADAAPLSAVSADAHSAAPACSAARVGIASVLDPLPPAASAEKAVEAALGPAMAPETQGLPLVPVFTFAIALVLFLLTAYLNSIMAKTAWKIAEKGRLNYDVLPLPDVMHSIDGPLFAILHKHVMWLPDALYVINLVLAILNMLTFPHSFRIGVTFVTVWGILFLLRATLIATTVLPSPIVPCRVPGLPDIPVLRPDVNIFALGDGGMFCNDLVFSGHATINIICAFFWALSPRSIPTKVFFAVFSAINVLVTLVTHDHYTIDVLLSLYLTSLVVYIFRNRIRADYRSPILVHTSRLTTDVAGIAPYENGVTGSSEAQRVLTVTLTTTTATLAATDGGLRFLTGAGARVAETGPESAWPLVRVPVFTPPHVNTSVLPSGGSCTTGSGMVAAVDLAVWHLAGGLQAVVGALKGWAAPRVVLRTTRVTATAVTHPVSSGAALDVRVAVEELHPPLPHRNDAWFACVAAGFYPNIHQMQVDHVSAPVDKVVVDDEEEDDGESSSSVVTTEEEDDDSDANIPDIRARSRSSARSHASAAAATAADGEDGGARRSARSRAAAVGARTRK